MLLDLTEKSKYRGINKHIRYELMREELLFIMLKNSLKDWFCYLPRESISEGVFPGKQARSYGLDLIWTDLYVTNLLLIFKFFYDNYISRLTSCIKCSKSVRLRRKVFVCWECLFRYTLHVFVNLFQLLYQMHRYVSITFMYWKCGI